MTDYHGGWYMDTADGSYYYYGGAGVFLFVLVMVCVVWALQFAPPGPYYYYNGVCPEPPPSRPPPEPRNVIALRIDRRYDAAEERPRPADV
jgi:hypothetical protein